MDGIEQLAAREGLDARATSSARTDLIVHGTTTADNTMIEMNGAATGLLTTAGPPRRDRASGAATRRTSGIRRSRRRRRSRRGAAALGVPERLDFRRQRRDAARRGRRARGACGGCAGRASSRSRSCFLFSFVNPAHERRVREIVARGAARASRISLSHEVMPTAPEFERTSTTLVERLRRPEARRATSTASSARCARRASRASC